MSNMYSDGNQFKFKCPVFDAETKMSSCEKLRSMVWRGEKPAQRKGCQAAMSGCVCPVARLHQRAWGSKIDTSRYFSINPVVGKLDRAILGSIQNVVVMSSTMTQYQISDAERSLLDSSRERIRKQLGTAPEMPSGRAKPGMAAKSTKARVKPASTAAVTGDMSSAINEA